MKSRYSVLTFLFVCVFNPVFSQVWVNDPSFYIGSGGNNSTGINHAIVDSYNRIIITGSFSTFNDTITNRFARLNPNGGIDTSFHVGLGFSTYVYGIAEQQDHKIIAAGDFSTYNGTATNKIVRINENGSIDNTFNPGSGADGTIFSVSIQSDEKILIAGDFTEFNGTPANKIARLNLDGSLDTTFNVGLGPNGGIGGFAIQPDGKIILVGNFTTFDSSPANYIVRLNEDGSLDNTFVANLAGIQPISSVFVQSGGDIILTGSFTEIDGVQMTHIARLNSAGQLDTQFDPGVGFNNVTMLRGVLQGDDKLLLYGSFTAYQNQQAKYLIRFNEDGSVDTTFNMGVGADDWVQAVGVQSGGRVIVCGKFNNFNGSSRNDLTRIFSCVSTNHTETQTACASFTWSINGQTYTTSGQYMDTIPNAAGCDSIITLDLTIIPSLPLTIDNSFSTPSDANSCVGMAAITISGNADFELDFDNGAQVLTSNGYSLVTGLCVGVHDLHVTDNCGDTLSLPVVIPVDSNYVFNNPFIDSLAVDSLGVTVTNCDIYYAGIDTAYIDSIWANGNTVNVVWNIVDSNGSNFDTTTYVLNNGNGVYWLQLSVFCPFKSVGEYFTVTEAIYFNNGSVSTAGLTDHQQALFEIYPNPTNNQVHISFSGSDAELTVYDLQGKVVLKDKIQNQGIISLQNFERGVYLFDFNNAQGHSVQRVVKQ